MKIPLSCFLKRSKVKKKKKHTSLPLITFCIDKLIRKFKIFTTKD